MKTINNDYDSIAHLWWSEEEGSTATIRYFINPVRFNYFKKILDARFPSGYSGMKALDLGCGGGILSEDLSRIGLRVTGVDPSGESLAVAREHAARGGLSIDYLTSSGEKLPFGDGSFDMVFCCDVLEHVSDLGKVISEISRVIKTGGVFFFDTINRTLISRVAIIYFMQECGLTAFGRGDDHLWSMFIRPGELRELMSRHSMALADLKGIEPRRMGPSILLNLYRASRKKISYRELGKRMDFTETDHLDCSYMGYGTKSGD
ncbi:MAG: 3-demethylubiquinone-9 3-O-methyltransferase [Spirochaetes bacterium]|nr:3-demethylubiquinone-9 3-O-methyltransferase [Spirochaetota bacterium]